MKFVFVRTGGSTIKYGLYGSPHARVAVAQERRAVAATQVDVFVAVEVPDAAPGGPVEQQRMSERPVDARRCADTAGENLLRPLKLCNDLLHVRIHGGALPKSSFAPRKNDFSQSERRLCAANRNFTSSPISPAAGTPRCGASVVAESADWSSWRVARRVRRCHERRRTGPRRRTLPRDSLGCRRSGFR